MSGEWFMRRERLNVLYYLFFFFFFLGIGRTIWSRVRDV